MFVFGAITPIIYWIQLMILGKGADVYVETFLPVALALVYLDYVSALLDSSGCCTLQMRTQLRMAMEELYVNVAHYAYPSGDSWAEIRGSIEDGVAVLHLIDGGTPYDPLAKPAPDTLLSGEERSIGGLGIYIVKSMVDDLQYVYRDGCNQLTVRKKL